MIFRIIFKFFIISLCLGLYAKDITFSVIFGKKISDSGNVTIAHSYGCNNPKDISIIKINNKDIPNFYMTKSNKRVYLKKKTSGFLWIKVNNKNLGDTFLTESGLFIASNSCKSKMNNNRKNDIGKMLPHIIAASCNNTNEAITLAIELINNYGFQDSGLSLIIADHKNAYIMQIVKGKQWIVKRIKDDHVAILTNSFTINYITPYNDDNLYSPDIIEYAYKKGWFKANSLISQNYDKKTKREEIEDITRMNKNFNLNIKNKYDNIFKKKEKEDIVKNIIKSWRLSSLLSSFNFSLCYGDNDNLASINNILRAKRAYKLITGVEFDKKKQLPFSRSINKTVDKEEIFNLLRDHYEGTPQDLSNGYKEGSPNYTSNLGICNRYTHYAVVAELKDNDKDFGTTLWLSMKRTDSNAFTPWFSQIKRIPEGYSSFNNYKDALKENISKATNKNSFADYSSLSTFVDSDYKKNIKKVRKEWRNFENYLIKINRKKIQELNYIKEKAPFLFEKLLENFVHGNEYRKWFLTIELYKNNG